MKTIETRCITNVNDWVIDGTNIFVIPQAVVSSNDPSTKNFTVRHGSVGRILDEKNGNWEQQGKIRILCDYIENGKDDFGGLENYSDVIELLKLEATNSLNIYNFAKRSDFLKAAIFMQAANKNNSLYCSRGISLEKAISMVKHSSIETLRNRAIAWYSAYKENKNAFKNGMIKDHCRID